MLLTSIMVTACSIFVNGQVSRDMEWTNLNLQDILPTWQWWVTSTDDNRLELDWDYGSKFYRYDSNGETYAFPLYPDRRLQRRLLLWCCTATCWVARR